MKKTVLSLLLIAATLCALMWAMPAAAAAEEADICLMYDDRKELASLVDATGTVEITDEQVTSYKVGTETPDDHVLVYEDGILYAVGTGTATLTVGEKTYSVTVEAAPISLFMINSHSISAGQEGNGSQSIVVEAGQAYSSYHPNSLDVTEVDGYGLGWGSENRVGGEEGLVREGWDSYGHLDSFAPGMGGTTGTGSGIAYRWNQLTGEKVWIINIGVGGSTLCEWVPGGKGHSAYYDPNYYDQTISKFTYAQTILKNEYAAGHYVVQNQAILYFPGANFTWYPFWSQETIHEHYELLWHSYEKDLFTVDIDGDGEVDGIDAIAMPAYWRDSVASSYDRPAVRYFASSEDYPGLVMVCDKLRYWAVNVSTFPEIDYETQSKPVYMPESVYHKDQGGSSENSLFCEDDTSHLSQVGYNAMGEDIGENLYSYLRNNGGEAEVTDFALLDVNNKEMADTVDIYVGESYLIAPVYQPVTVSNLTYELTGDAAELVWPLQVKGLSVGQATLTVKQEDNVLAQVTFRILPAHTHCECGGTLTGVAAENHTCTDSLTYVPLNRGHLTNYRYDNAKNASVSVQTVLRGGNYFLTGNISFSELYIASGDTVNLCLNGYKLTTTERSFRPNGNLNICDCSAEGTGAVHSKYTGTAPFLYTYSGACVNIYGGNFTAVEGNREFAGLIGVYRDAGMLDYDADDDGVLDDPAPSLSDATLNIYGGKFYGTDLSCSDGSPTGSGRGGCIILGAATNTLRIYDGEFHGAQTVPVADGGKGGGGIIAAAVGNLELYGGTFLGSTDPKGAIYFAKEVQLSGKLSFDNGGPDLYAGSGGMLNVGQLDEETSIVLGTAVLDTPVVTLSDAAQATQFSAIHYLIQTDGTTLSLTASKCICGGTLSEEAISLSGHQCKDVEWATFDTSLFTVTDSKYIPNETELNLILAKDWSIAYPIEIPDGYTLRINLNGYTLSASKILSSSLLRVYGNLSICDTSAEQTGLVQGIRKTGSETTTVSLINYSTATSTAYTPQFDLYGGTLTGYNVDATGDTVHTYAKQGGVMQIGNNSNNQNPVFNIYGGVIRDGVAMTAGNVFLSQGTINMYDGLITGGKIVSGNGTGTKYYGGNLRTNSKTTLNMYGGTISNGTNEVEHGGNVFTQGSEVNLLGGVIENGYSAKQGGNLYISAGTVNIDNVRIRGGEAGTRGGNISIASAPVVRIANSQILYGMSQNNDYGGNIYTSSNDLTVENSQIVGGSGGSGGNLFVYSGNVVVTGTTISDGRAGYTYTRNADGSIAYTEGTVSASGGNIYMYAGTLEMTDCTVSGGMAHLYNKSNGFGGNIYHRSTLKLTDCTISGGDGRYGGGISIRDNGSNPSVTELIDCTFLGNSTSNTGSSVGVWANSLGATVTATNCSFDDSEGSSVYGVISVVPASGLTGTVSLTLDDCQITNLANKAADRYGLYMQTGTVTLKGNTTIDAANADVYLENSTLYISEDYTNTDTVGFDCAEGGKVVPQGSCAANLEAQGTLHLDLNGQDMTGSITGSGTVLLTDSATDEFVDNSGSFTGSVTASLSPLVEADEKTYLILNQDGVYSSHRCVLQLTHLSLKPAQDALGYKAEFVANDTVRGLVTEFGYQLWAGDNAPKTYAIQGSFTSGQVVTLRLKNILASNAGLISISGQPFIRIGDTVITGQSYSTTMKETLETVNEQWSTYSDTQKTAVQALCEANPVTGQWNLANIFSNSNIAYTGIADIYEPQTGIVNAPTAVQWVRSEMPAATGKTPAVALLEIDSDLNILSSQQQVLGTVAQFQSTAASATIPAFVIDSQAEADSIVGYITNYGIQDAFVVAQQENAVLVRQVRTQCPTVRGALIFDSLSTAQQRKDARALLNNNLCYVAISQTAESAQTSQYFSTRQLVLWCQVQDTADVMRAVSNGYAGAVAEDAAVIYQVYESITEATVSGKPIVVAHRGAHIATPENTLEGIRAARDTYGVNAVEVDIRRSSDGVLFLMHDSTVDRTTDGTGTAEEMTWAQLEALVVDEKVETYGETAAAKIPKWEDIVKEFQGTDMVFYCHIKAGADNTVEEFSRIVEEYGFQDNVVFFVSYDCRTTYNYTSSLICDGISFVSGTEETLLTSAANDLAAIGNMTAQLVPYNYQPLFYDYDLYNTGSFYYQMAARGFVNILSANNTAANLKNYLLLECGATGTLTDRPDRTANYHYQILAQDQTLSVGQSIATEQTLQMIFGTETVTCGMTQLSGPELQDGTLTEAGTVTVVFYVDHTTDSTTDSSATYRVYSEPVTISFQ